MIVIDASAMIELLLRTARVGRVEKLVQQYGDLHAPELLDIEVVQVLHRYHSAGDMSHERVQEALLDFTNCRVTRHGHRPHVSRMWQLQDSLTAYDAAYLALAEYLPAPLITCDPRLAMTKGHKVLVELL